MTNSIVTEYKNLLDTKISIESSLSLLPIGYISQKLIKGKTYCYLQTRVSGKLTSRYLKADEVASVTDQIALRKKQEAQLPQIALRLGELEQAALLIDKRLSRQLAILKLSAGMDNMDAAQKERSASFAGAMNAIEGIAISKETEQDIMQWKAGSKSFLSVFETTLRRYGFSQEV